MSWHVEMIPNASAHARLPATKIRDFHEQPSARPQQPVGFTNRIAGFGKMFEYMPECHYVKGRILKGRNPFRSNYIDTEALT